MTALFTFAPLPVIGIEFFSATSFCVQCNLSFEPIHPSIHSSIFYVGKLDPFQLSSSRPSD